MRIHERDDGPRRSELGAIMISIDRRNRSHHPQTHPRWERVGRRLEPRGRDERRVKEDHGATSRPAEARDGTSHQSTSS